MKRMLSLLSVAVLSLGLMSSSLYAANPAPAPNPAPNGQGGGGGGERHPAIRAAIGALQRAKDDLQHADHDFGGHRVDAIQAIDRAMEQLRIALQYDKK